MKNAKTIYRGRVLHLIKEAVTYRGRRLVRETILHPGAAVIVPMLDRRRVVMVRQYRHAVRRELLELPAGTLDPGESALTCARRELIEETGWSAKRWRRLVQFFAAPGYTNEQMTVYLAADLSPATADQDEDEMVRPVVLPLSRALSYIDSGRICDSKSIIGLLLAHRRRT